MSLPTQRSGRRHALDLRFITSTYRDVAEADADRRDVMNDTYRRSAPPTDVVIVGRKVSGEARFHTDVASWADMTDRDRTVSMAAGLALLLYPSVGADVPASEAHGRAVLNAVAGVVARAVGRRAQMELGTHLDSASAVQIVAAHSSEVQRIRSLLSRARSIRTVDANVDEWALQQAVATASSVSSASRGDQSAR